MQRSETILAILVMDQLSIIPMKSFKIQPSSSEGDGTFKVLAIFSSGGHFVQQSGTILAILEKGHLSIIPMKLFQIWPSGSGGDLV